MVNREVSDKERQELDYLAQQLEGMRNRERQLQEEVEAVKDRFGFVKAQKNKRQERFKEKAVSLVGMVNYKEKKNSSVIYGRR